MSLPSIVERHLGPGEEVWAVARVEPVMGPVAAYLVVTDHRLMVLQKSGLFAWDQAYFPLSGIMGARVYEGPLRAKVTFLLDIVKAPDGVTGPREFTYPDIRKDEAAELVSALDHLLTKGGPESMAYQTKRCPQCDEIVKARARVCKHCGFRF